jgi:hypothetical protein
MRKLGTAIMGSSDDKEPASTETIDVKKGSRAAR